jgi:hypothetical protein
LARVVVVHGLSVQFVRAAVGEDVIEYHHTISAGGSTDADE